MLWIVVPSGMCEIGRALPTRASAPSRRPRRHRRLQAVGQEHVALLAVAVVQQADASGAVWVVLDRRDPRRHAVLVALEVDAPIVGLLAAAAMAHGEPALVVPARATLLRLEQRLVGLGGRDLLERRAGHPATAGRGGLVAAQRHAYTPSKNWIFWPAARVTMALRQGDVVPRIRPRRVPRDFSLAFVVRTLTATTLTLSAAYSSSIGRLDLDLVGVGMDAERVAPARRLVDRLLADDRAQDDLGRGERAHR